MEDATAITLTLTNFVRSLFKFVLAVEVLRALYSDCCFTCSNWADIVSQIFEWHLCELKVNISLVKGFNKGLSLLNISHCGFTLSGN